MPGLAVILGCGPAGLAAASAAVSSGREALIISNTEKPSNILGCQYLHAPIPGYEWVGKVSVSYKLNGTAEQYRRKVYGSEWTGTVSPEDFIGEHDAWDIRETYQAMWRDLIGSTQVGLIIKYVKRGLIPYVNTLKPELIVSTIPAQALCDKHHDFTSHTIWANGSTVYRPMAPNEVICDGTESNNWYRISNVFGYKTTEWPSMPHRSVRAIPVIKPLSTNCDCHPEVLRAGRYGNWQKKRLVHEVYPAVMEALE